MLRKRRTSGWTVVECVLSIAMIALTMVILAGFQMMQATQIGLENQRVRAEQMLANLADQILTEPWDDLTDERLSQLASSIAASNNLPNGSIRIDMHEESTPIAGRRFELISESANKFAPRHQLVVWRFSVADASSSNRVEAVP